MATVDLSIELECESCGATLDVDQRKDVARVIPCKDCLEAAKDSGYKEGIKEGEKSNG